MEPTKIIAIFPTCIQLSFDKEAEKKTLPSHTPIYPNRPRHVFASCWPVPLLSGHGPASETIWRGCVSIGVCGTRRKYLTCIYIYIVYGHFNVIFSRYCPFIHWIHFMHGVYLFACWFIDPSIYFRCWEPIFPLNITEPRFLKVSDSWWLPFSWCCNIIFL